MLNKGKFYSITLLLFSYLCRRQTDVFVNRQAGITMVRPQISMTSLLHVQSKILTMVVITTYAVKYYLCASSTRNPKASSTVKKLKRERANSRSKLCNLNSFLNKFLTH